MSMALELIMLFWRADHEELISLIFVQFKYNIVFSLTLTMGKSCPSCQSQQSAAKIGTNPVRLKFHGMRRPLMIFTHHYSSEPRDVNYDGNLEMARLYASVPADNYMHYISFTDGTNRSARVFTLPPVIPAALPHFDDQSHLGKVKRNAAGNMGSAVNRSNE
jgi:hypothetical protein